MFSFKNGTKHCLFLNQIFILEIVILTCQGILILFSGKKSHSIIFIVSTLVFFGFLVLFLYLIRITKRTFLPFIMFNKNIIFLIVVFHLNWSIFHIFIQLVFVCVSIFYVAYWNNKLEIKQ